MDSIYLGPREDEVGRGLCELMFYTFDCNDEMIQSFVEPEWALWIVEVCKRAPDTERYFPKGKWATIQSIQQKIDAAFSQITFLNVQNL